MALYYEIEEVNLGRRGKRVIMYRVNYGIHSRTFVTLAAAQAFLSEMEPWRFSAPVRLNGASDIPGARQPE